MEVNFSYAYIDTDLFELEYEEELREDTDLRKDIINHGLVLYVYDKDFLVGECFGISPVNFACILNQGQGFDEEDAIVDADMADSESVYVWSTTILPKFRGLGYGKLLRQEFAKYASKMGYAKLIGHATSPGMVHIAKDLGAIFRESAVHHDWYSTNRTAYFYTQFLTQTKEYNCGPFALAYLLETKGHTFLTEDLEKQLSTNNEYGTNPTHIEKFLQRNKIQYRRTKELVPNSVIDITVENDGHWITLIQKMNDMWQVYDPDRGIRFAGHKELLRDWHSPRYGIRQGFTLL